MLFLPYYAYFFSSIFFYKIGDKGRTGCLEVRGMGVRVKEGDTGGWRNDPNNVHTCE
jgi:hypothetical protein